MPGPDAAEKVPMRIAADVATNSAHVIPGFWTKSVPGIDGSTEYVIVKASPEFRVSRDVSSVPDTA